MILLCTSISQERLCVFVEYSERLYGHSCAALFRESPFVLNFQFKLVDSLRPSGVDGFQWFIDKLKQRFI